MSLADRFAEFLSDRADDRRREVLARDLEEAGYLLEALLLGRWARGETETEIDIEDFVWSGRRAWVGSMLPASAEAGDVWLDVCELMPTILLPRELGADPSEFAPGVLERLTPFVSWFALRPVANWQFATFLELARLVPRRVQIDPPVRALDPERIMRGGETEPVSGLLPDEAGLYAGWFGKALADLEDWQAAALALAPQELAALWGPLRREWAGSVTEGVYVVVTPETIDVDPDEALDEDPGLERPDRILYGELEAPVDVGFRTHVSTQLGLRSVGGPDPLSILDVQLLDSVDRAA